MHSSEWVAGIDVITGRKMQRRCHKNIFVEVRILLGNRGAEVTFSRNSLLSKIIFLSRLAS
jgi:hypothetical protein